MGIMLISVITKAAALALKHVQADLAHFGYELRSLTHTGLKGLWTIL